MRKKLGSVLQYLFFLGLGLGLIWYSLHGLSPVEVAEMKASFSETRLVYLLPVLICLLISHYSRAERWRLMMEPLNYRPGLANTYLMVLIGYFFNLLVPRLGEVMKCTLLSRYEKIPSDKLIGTIVAERAIDVISLLVVILIMVSTQFNLLGQSTLQTLRGMGGTEAFTKILLLLALLGFLSFLLRWAMKKYQHLKPVKAIYRFASGITQGLLSVRKLNRLGAFMLHTINIWLMYLGSIYLGFLAFPQVAHLGLAASVAILVFGSFGMIATQGGVGAYQLAVQKTLLLYGVSSVAGLTFGWILWGAQFVIILLSGVVALVLLPIINKKTTHATNHGHTN
ncbi:MAG: flippase-like domain-containing protein [Chitinophagaceae bacterium]|nr:flippase-like domain-containing protein [Chitinophagaceae bacterium]